MKIIAPALVLTLSGCTTVGLTRLDDTTQAKPEGCALEGYSHSSALESPHVAVCDLTSSVTNLPWSQAKATTAVENALPLLCKCGADAFIIGGWNQAPFQASMHIVGIKYGTPSEGKRAGAQSVQQILDGLGGSDDAAPPTRSRHKP